MKKILIIYPHWPPSNLAGVHRPRLIANFLSDFGWEPTILTVHADYYEELLDFKMLKTVKPGIQVHFVTAFKPLKRFRFFGDIGLRGFFQLYTKALDLTMSNAFDFIWIPVPSNYTAVLGRLLYQKRKIPYGIDYIDPWVNGFTGGDKIFSKAWLSDQIARVLEPFSVKHASVISGVSRAYFQPVIDRNFKNKPVYSVGMPYGFDPNDHTIALEDVQLPWHSIPNCIPFVYAGVFYQGAHLFTKTLFQSIANLKKKGNWNPNFHFFFLGTGNYVEKSILAYASEYGIDDCIHEVRNRLPYLDILTILSKSAGIMILGSIEKYYTASKTFQAILSKKPVYAVLHAESTAVTLMQAVGAATYLTTYLENIPLNVFQSNIQSDFEAFILGQRNWSPNFNALNNYSAKVSTQLLVEQINLAIQK